MGGGGVGVQADSPHRRRRQHPSERFLRYLPDWCHGGGDFRNQICVNLWSTEAVADEMKRLAEEKDTQEGEGALIEKSVDRSIILLKHVLPWKMEDFDQNTHKDAVITIAHFAAVFCWWLKWITGTDPTAYSALLERVGQVTRIKLWGMKESAANTSPVRIATGIVRTQSVSPRSTKPYARRPIKKEEPED